MGKNDLKAQILKLDPENAIAKDTRSSLIQLETELRRVKQKIVDSSSDTTLPATVRYRVEDRGFSWKIEGEDFLSELGFGPELPCLGSRTMGDDGETFVVTEQLPGLTIRARDLKVREEFDPRRIYSRNGIDVVFKRLESSNDKPVLWSFKQNMEIVVGPHVELTRTDKIAKPTAGSGQKMTQKNLASYLISRKPSITGAELTAELKQAFPDASIGDRHGPHYISLSRNGRLPEASEDDPRLWK